MNARRPGTTPYARRVLARVLQATAPGTVFTIDSWREAADAAGLTGSEKSGAHRWAMGRGYLTAYPMPPGLVAAARTRHQPGDGRLVEVWVRSSLPVVIPGVDTPPVGVYSSR